MERTEIEYIEYYQQTGYTSEYQLKNENLIDVKSKREYTSNAVFIVAEHRFEGISNPSDMSILYIIETDDGSKGRVLVPYGAANSTSLAEFFTKIPKEHCSNKAAIQKK